MGDKRAAGRDVARFERDGIEVEADRTYMRSWPGVQAVSRLRDEGMAEGERFLLLADYCSAACPNIDDVAAELERRASEEEPPREVTAADVMAFAFGVLNDNTPKN